MRIAWVFLMIGTLAASAGPAWAQFKKEDTGGAVLGEAQTERWKAGMTITATNGVCRGMIGYVPVPVDWPEQKVSVVEEEVSPETKISYQTVAGNPKLMVVHVGTLRAGETAKALVTFEITRHALLAPEPSQQEQYVLADPKKLDATLRMYLAPSPLIEVRDPKIRQLAKEIGVNEPTAWKQVEAVYDWVREKIQYKNGPIKGALAALKDGTGDCEELTSLFIAILRAKEIPARTVWVQGHCYPEFYLLDKEGNGYWFPCQVAGSRAFGGIPEFRPILQKGDSFRLPDNRSQRVRYLPERVTGSTAGADPRVEFVRERVGNK